MYWQFGRAHRAMLAAVDRSDREDDQRREAAREAWAYQCATRAAEYYECVEAQRAAQAVVDARLEREAEQRRQERIYRARDHTAMLLATGQGRLRTVDEVLASMAGWGF